MKIRWLVLAVALALSAPVVAGCTPAQAVAPEASPTAAPQSTAAPYATAAPAVTVVPPATATPAAEGEVVEGWAGTILKQEPGNQLGPFFQRVDGQRCSVGSSDPALRKQIADLRGSGLMVRVWGRLFIGVPADQARHIEVERLEIVR